MRGMGLVIAFATVFSIAIFVAPGFTAGILQSVDI